jgi:hypothetical protein
MPRRPACKLIALKQDHIREAFLREMIYCRAARNPASDHNNFCPLAHVSSPISVCARQHAAAPCVQWGIFCFSKTRFPASAFLKITPASAHKLPALLALLSREFWTTFKLGNPKQDK